MPKKKKALLSLCQIKKKVETVVDLTIADKEQQEGQADTHHGDCLHLQLSLCSYRVLNGTLHHLWALLLHQSDFSKGGFATDAGKF